MDKPRIFLGSSGLQKKLLQALTRGLEDVAHVVPWTTSFNPGTTTLVRLFELAREVDFAALAFARDDWTAAGLGRVRHGGTNSGEGPSNRSGHRSGRGRSGCQPPAQAWLSHSKQVQATLTIHRARRADNEKQSA